MAKSSEKPSKESTAERLSRFGRNVNALGALAIGGVAMLVPGPNIILGAWAAVNAAQAGGFELLRRSAEKSRKKKKT